MADVASRNRNEMLFSAGPRFSTGPEFAHDLNIFVTRYGSPSAVRFVDLWLGAGERNSLPAWTDLRLYQHPDLMANTFLLERPNNDPHDFVRFIGAEAIARSGIDPTGHSLASIDNGELLERWTSANSYCIENDAVCAVSFDLRFVDKEFRRLVAVIFPLASSERSDFTCGYYIWQD